MSRRSKQKHQTAPSLFPFLAVLICTMGAIIVLLVLVVKRADVQADEATKASKEELEKKRTALSDQLTFQESQVKILSGLRPGLKARLDAEKTVTGHLADHRSRLQAEYQELKSSLDSLAADGLAKAETETIVADIDNLKTSIEAAQEELRKKQEAQRNVRPSFAIIPRARGGQGTFRRPLFVECDEKGVTLQPYGITLTSQDFPRSMDSGNPLDVALLMIRDYWNQLDPNQEQGQPYPLFVVRPSGPRSFAAARKAMKSWVDEFGYELVNADVEVRYPEYDESFKKRLSIAVQDARAKQQQLIASRKRQQALSQIRRLKSGQSGSSSGGYRASSVSGGFVREPGRGSSNGGTTRFASQARSSFPPLGNSTTAGSVGSDPSVPPNRLTAASGRGSATTSVARHSPFRPGGQNSPTTQSASSTPSSSANRTSSFGQDSGSSSARVDQNAGRGPAGSAQQTSGSGTPEPTLQSLARKRGKDWALPSKSNHSIQVKKPIKVQIGPDAIRIVEFGKGIRSIPFKGTTSTAVPELIEQVWKHIDAWGIAGVNSYWKPVLNLQVAPGASDRFRELKVLLAGSGLELKRVEP